MNTEKLSDEFAGLIANAAKHQPDEGVTVAKCMVFAAAASLVLMLGRREAAEFMYRAADRIVEDGVKK